MIQEIAQSLYADSPDELLYHYTTISGFKGIIESQCLWASDVRYMNDSAELQYIIGLLRECSREFQEHKKFLSQFIDWMGHRITNGHMVFAASFRANGNLLSQWRGYSQIGKGISVGFKGSDIAALATQSGFQLGRCIYQRDRQIALIAKVVKYIIEIAEKDENSETESDAFFNKIEADMLRIAALLKHPSFAEEEEWRLVSPVITDYLSASVDFREGNAMLIPYYKFPMSIDGSTRKKDTTDLRQSLSVEHVFVGPTPNSRLSLNSIRLYLTKRGVMPEKDISYCDIPYRNR